MKARSRSSSIPKKPFRWIGIQRNAPLWTKTSVLRELKGLADPKARAKMAYFGVHVPKAYGISAPVLHQFARHIGKDHRLARHLWTTGIHEARILATLIGEAEKVTAAEMDRWVRDFDAWTWSMRRAVISTLMQSLPGIKRRRGAGAAKSS